MRTLFRTSFRGARGIALGFLLTLALGGAAYAVTTTVSTADFSLTAPTATATTSPGGSVGYGINLQAVGGFSDNVTLAVTSPLPAGVTASFGTNPAFVDSSLASASTLWINTSPTQGSSTPTPTGSSTIIVTGTSSTGASHTVQVTLNVVPSGSPDYTIQMTPTTQYVSAGKPATYNIKVVPVNGFTGNVTLSANSIPGAVSLGWNGLSSVVTSQNPTISIPVGGSAKGTATLTVGTSQTNPPGSYAITVTGTSVSSTGGSISHNVAGVLNIDLFSASGSISTPLYPGAAAQYIPVTLTDPYGYSVTVTGLSASVAQDSSGNVLDSSGNPVPGCLASWFAFKDTPLSSTNTLPLAGGSMRSLPSGDLPMISMLNKPVNQDACEGVQLKLNFVGTAQK